jgi:ArsR family transcriptional regulator
MILLCEQMGMAETDRSSRDADDLAGLLPEDSLLSLDEYLAMQRSIGNETRFRILNFLTERGAQSAKELEQGLDLPSNTLHYHLDALVDVGLVENRKRKTPSSDGLYSYYQATSLGEGILEHGVRELMREEWDLLDAYTE